MARRLVPPWCLRAAPTFRSLSTQRPPRPADTALAQFQSRPPDRLGLRASRPRSPNSPADPRGGPPVSPSEGHPLTQTPAAYPTPLSSRSYSQTRQNSNLAPPPASDARRTPTQGRAHWLRQQSCRRRSGKDGRRLTLLRAI